ncbi:shikimate kinase AroK [Buchnera aphidicola]|uniref:shikimate kinase AroK n=1 Tax=Buchnera aphidicola TaxID=9 RepID=UPI0031B83BC9
MTEKRNIFLIGPMGAGKSTIGRQLSKQLRMDFYDSDYEIEQRTGADISWVFDIEGEQGFREREKKIINELTQYNGIVLATGGGSIKSKSVRMQLVSRGIVVFLKTTIDEQLLRTKNDKKRPLLTTDISSRREILQKLAMERDNLYNEIADIVVNTKDRSAKFVANRIINLLEKHS